MSNKTVTAETVAAPTGSNDDLYNTPATPAPADDTAPVEEAGTAPKMSFNTDANDIAPEDIAKPTIKLTQSLSPVVQEEKIGAGYIYIDGLGSLGKSLVIVPRGFNKGTQPNPRTGVEEQYYVFEVAAQPAGALTDQIIGTMWFKGSQLGTAREILGAVTRAGGFCKNALTLTVEKKTNKHGSWYVYGLTPATLTAEQMERAATAQY